MVHLWCLFWNNFDGLFQSFEYLKQRVYCLVFFRSSSCLEPMRYDYLSKRETCSHTHGMSLFRTSCVSTIRYLVLIFQIHNCLISFSHYSSAELFMSLVT